MWKKFEEKYESILDSNLLNKILWMNGITSKEKYEELLSDDYFPFDINVEGFITKIDYVLENNKRIVVVGDYDVDGVCATSIMVKFLKSLSIDTKWILPNRFIDGYGLKRPLVDKAFNLGCDVIITVDNGIKSKDAIAYAKEKGIDVLVTDHHQPDLDNIPNDVEIINPHYQNEHLKFKEICGASVAYICAKNYYSRTNKGNEKLLLEMEELTSIATIADVMPLYKGNRKMIKKFIRRVKTNSIYNLGLLSLLEVAKVNVKSFNSEDMGYIIGPMLNAPGRLKTADIGVELFLSKNEETAKENAKLCYEFNQMRKDETHSLKSQVEINLEDLVHVVKFENANEGLIGIIAGDITEETGRPSFVFTKTHSGNYKGSGRSPLNYNLIEGADRVLKKHPELTLGYGGHSGAMGITLVDEDSVRRFQILMNADYNKQSVKEMDRNYIFFHKEKDSFEKICNEMQTLEPFGEGLMQPIFQTFGFPNFIKDLGKGSAFSLATDSGKYLNFARFREKVDKGFQVIYFTLKKELYNEKTYFKGYVEDMSLYKKPK